ncbi:MAG: hypothetical protein WB796_19260, partial [Candidatus Sulfotelmatobacter sp.]
RPNCPPVPWGATSVVAIPTPSFDLERNDLSSNDPHKMIRPNFNLGETDYYTAAALPRHTNSPARSREEPIWERDRRNKMTVVVRFDNYTTTVILSGAAFQA